MTKQRSRRARRRAPASILTAAVLVAALAVTLLLEGCGAATPQESASAPPSAAASAAARVPPATATSPSPGASVAVAFPSPSSSAEAEPPLERPTRKHPLHVYFGGDSLAGMPGVWLGVLRQKDGLAEVTADYVESSRLTSKEPVDWPTRLSREMSSGRYDIGVFMIGANDSGMPMIAGGKSVMYPEKAWLEEYERRARQITTIMLRVGAQRVYWVGMPVMPSSSDSKKMRDLNAVFESVAASSPDVEYVDSYDLLSTRSGGLDESLRSGDGVHYTDAGAKTVARAVWKAIEQDWGGE